MCYKCTLDEIQIQAVNEFSYGHPDMSHTVSQISPVSLRDISVNLTQHIQISLSTHQLSEEMSEADMSGADQNKLT